MSIALYKRLLKNSTETPPAIAPPSCGRGGYGPQVSCGAFPRATALSSSPIVRTIAPLVTRDNSLAQCQGDQGDHRQGGAQPYFQPKYTPDLDPIEKLFAKSHTSFARRRPETGTLSTTHSRQPSKPSRPKSGYLFQGSRMNGSKIIPFYRPAVRPKAATEAQTRETRCP